MTEAMIRAAALAVFGTVTALLIRRANPETALLLAMSVCCALMAAALRLTEPILEFLDRARELTGLSGAILSPALKCLGLALIARLAADLCRDGGQGAMASAVELSGAVCSVYAALPLLLSFLDMLEDLL